jgi:very-short-patch-repair endonuclease
LLNSKLSDKTISRLKDIKPFVKPKEGSFKLSKRTLSNLEEIRQKPKLRSSIIKPNSKYGSVHYNSEVKPLIDWVITLGICYTSLIYYLKKEGDIYFIDQERLDARKESELVRRKEAVGIRRRERKLIKWEDPFTALMWELLRKKRLRGQSFRCWRYLNRLGTTFTFYCAKYKLVIEPLRGTYTRALKAQDKFLYEKGYYVYRMKKSRDRVKIRSNLLSVLVNFKVWKKELGISLGVLSGD